MKSAFLSHADAALRNRNSVLHYVRYHESISRTDIWEAMNISRASVTQVIRQLQENNLVIETGEGESTGGRRPKYLVFNGAAKKLYAFDWSSRTFYLTDLNGTVIYENTLNFAPMVRPASFAATLLQELAYVESLRLCPEEEIIGLGVALPGLVDSRKCAVIHSVELGWQNVDIQELFAGKFRHRVYLERIGNAMALGAYHHGHERKTNHFQLFIIGHDGIGVSTIIRGDCQHGAGCMHGELGHIKLNSAELCSCGQRGCLEAVVSRALVSSGGEITQEILEYLAIGISTGINLSDPSEILIVGSFVNQMSKEQRAFLETATREKVTGKHMRQLNIRYSRDTKTLAFNGIVDYVFNQYFAID